MDAFVAWELSTGTVGRLGSEAGGSGEHELRHRSIAPSQLLGLNLSHHFPPKTQRGRLASAPLSFSRDSNAMISRTFSSTVRKSASLMPPVRKRDTSTSPGVDVKALTVLPRLPVPALRSTLDKYLQSLKPILLQDDLHGDAAFDSAYQQRVQWAREFEAGIGATLQARLVGTSHSLSTPSYSVSRVTIIALDKGSPHNWLDDNFWLKKAYLEWRAPLLINSNWWLIFQDDTEIPESAKNGLWETVIGLSPWQIRRGASLVYHSLVYKDTLSGYVCLPIPACIYDAGRSLERC